MSLSRIVIEQDFDPNDPPSMWRAFIECNGACLRAATRCGTTPWAALDELMTELVHESTALARSAKP